MSLARAFTLIELLLVVAIIAAAAGMVGTSFFSKRDARHQAVVAAAHELAATCRQARALAMSRQSTYAVVFHLQNAPDSNGRVLNNRSGGHWYRLLGPKPTTPGTQLDAKLDMLDGLPDIQVGSSSGGSWYVRDQPYTLGDAQRLVEQSWVGEAHTLPRGKARILALTDMDYGDWDWSNWTPNARQPSATASYPRPWFGWYDAATKRLFPWGGYDAAISPASGFYFWGTAGVVGYVPPARDPQPITCTNPATRILDRWAVGQESLHQAANMPASDTLYAVGSPRPLINASWRDASLVFTSSGAVCWGGWLRNRRNEFFKGATAGVAERCNPGMFGWGLKGTSTFFDEHATTEAGCFDAATGGWYITLAPDAVSDDDSFPTAAAALDSMMPMYRVFVSALGEVRVVAVSRNLVMPTGWSTFPASANWWQSVADVKRYFPHDRCLDGSSQDAAGVGRGVPVGAAITDALTPEMLVNRAVWMR